MKLFGRDLGDDRNHKQDGKYGCAYQVTKVHGHGNGIAASLAERGRQDFYDPEDQRHFWHLAHHVLFFHAYYFLTTQLNQGKPRRWRMAPACPGLPRDIA